MLTSIKRGTQTETFTHNAAGAMTRRTLAGVTTNYSYDQAGRLKEVKVGSVPIAEYQYDAYGRLIKTTEGTQETIRLPMGNETAYEKVITPGMPTVERRYIIALGKYIARDEISAGLTSRVYYHGDHLGSTRALSGDDTGSFTYDPFGNLVNSTGDAAEHSHQFTGKPIQSTGLYYYGARFYDPTLGRFINMDPAKDGNNWWVYCNQNPLMYVDLTGMNPVALNWAHFGGRVHIEFGVEVIKNAPIEGTYVNRSLSTISSKSNPHWEPSLLNRALRPDIVYNEKFVLELKPAGQEVAAVKQAKTRYVNNSNQGLKLGNSEEFMMNTFGASSYTLPNPIPDNFGRNYEVTINSNSSTAALTYTKRYMGRNEAYDKALVSVCVGVGVTLLAPGATPLLVPAFAY